ncbi:glutaredoxin-C7-like [Curcuma longa]|uniref:glutaredoxin-C7-like n=1 Tax=Curcuma longa TaxID=136217 RepID=UPI003D9E9515
MEVAASSADGGLRLGTEVATGASLAIDGGEAPERRTARMVREVIRESPVVVVGRRGCFMCHVIRRLLAAVGVHATVIELEEGESSAASAASLPALFIGGESVGGIEGLIALHLGGRLVPLLRAAGA